MGGVCVGFPVLLGKAAARVGVAMGEEQRELGSEPDGPRMQSWGGGVRRTTIGLRNLGAECFTVVSHLQPIW